MKFLFAVVAVVVTSTAVYAATPATCYGFFPGAKGKACCDKSYSRAPQGSMSDAARRAELEACTGKPAKLQ